METTTAIDIPEERGSAVAILSLAWRSIPLGTFDQRRIWEIFQNRVISCARQSISLQSFFELLCRKVKVMSLQGTAAEREAAAAILESDNSDAVLAEIRKHPQLCVLHVRVAQEQKKLNWGGRQ